MNVKQKKQRKGVRRVAIEVKIIDSAEKLMNLKPYYVDKLLWGTKEIPETYVYLGFVPGDGFYLKMVCEESNPLRTYENDQDPVYRDSAMEAFFQFETDREREQALYLNLEMNANGALLAAYGAGRTYRTYFSKDEMKTFGHRAEILDDRWSIEAKLPVELLEKVYGPLHLDDGSVFYCNFYKISETAEIEHYASCFPIKTEIPSFHLPEYFGEAVIVGE